MSRRRIELNPQIQSRALGRLVPARHRGDVAVTKLLHETIRAFHGRDNDRARRGATAAADLDRDLQQGEPESLAADLPVLVRDSHLGLVED
jgi:hypothetical protein